MPHSPRPVATPGPDAIRRITPAGLDYVAPDGAVRHVSFAECQANLALRLPRATPDGVPLVGLRDGTAETPWIEFATVPPTRFTFARTEAARSAAGGRFASRRLPSAYLDLVAAVATHGYAFGDLG